MPSNLEYLEEIDLTSSSISLDNLFGLLQKTPKLKQLNLFFCRDLNANSEVLPGNLEHLEKINLNYVDISSENLIHLLKSAPNLSELSIISCKITDPQNPELMALLEKIPCVKREFPQADYKDVKNVSPIFGSAGPSDFFAQAFKSPHLQPLPPQKTCQVDANTKRISPETELNARQIFYSTNDAAPPDVTLLRLGIYDQLKINPHPTQINQAFELNQTPDLRLEPHKAQQCHEDVFEITKKHNEKTDGTYYYGKQSFALTGDWQPIASLSPNETLTHYHVSPQDSSIEIQYSTVYNQYFIKSHSGHQTIDLDFAVYVPPKNIAPLPRAIQDCIAYYLSFGSGTLNLGTANPTGEDYLKAIIKQKIGACRHRVIALKSELDQAKIPCRIGTNDCHAFLEIQIDGQWHTVNLGGYSAQLTIDDSNRPTALCRATPKSHSTHVVFDG